MANPKEIKRRIIQLRETYGDFPVETATYNLSPEAYERSRELHEDGFPGAARVWVERDGEALLVREENRPASWGVAGGLIEPDERADRAGEREVLEETNIKCKIANIDYVHRATSQHESREREPIEEIAVAFIAEYGDGSPLPQEEEIQEVKWWSSLPENVHSPANRIGATRLAGDE